MEPAPPLPEADPGAGDTPPPGEVTVGHEVELQGRDRLDRVGDPSGTPERDEKLQQPVAGQRNGTPDQREQPLLPTPESRKDSAEQSAPSVLGPPRSGHRSYHGDGHERFAGASGGAPTDTEGEAVSGPNYPARRAINVMSEPPSGQRREAGDLG